MFTLWTDFYTLTQSYWLTRIFAVCALEPSFSRARRHKWRQRSLSPSRGWLETANEQTASTRTILRFVIIGHSYTVIYRRQNDKTKYISCAYSALHKTHWQRSPIEVLEVILQRCANMTVFDSIVRHDLFLSQWATSCELLQACILFHASKIILDLLLRSTFLFGSTFQHCISFCITSPFNRSQDVSDDVKITLFVVFFKFW